MAPGLEKLSVICVGLLPQDLFVHPVGLVQIACRALPEKGVVYCHALHISRAFIDCRKVGPGAIIRCLNVRPAASLESHYPGC